MWSCLRPLAERGSAGRWFRCQDGAPCHDVGEKAKNKIGPVLNGLEGRKTGCQRGRNEQTAHDRDCHGTSRTEKTGLEKGLADLTLNDAPRPNSLLTAKITGNFAESCHPSLLTTRRQGRGDLRGLPGAEV